MLTAWRLFRYYRSCGFSLRYSARHAVNALRYYFGGRL